MDFTRASASFFIRWRKAFAAHGQGKMTIVISKFLPGFIANRLRSALSREVLFLLDNGFATPELDGLRSASGM
jgi:3-hydroxyacyl-CoA dehydrogenase